MQYSIYAFLPFGILSGMALIAGCISLSPMRLRGKPRPVLPAITAARSAEIFYFPPRARQPSFAAPPKAKAN